VPVAQAHDSGAAVDPSLIERLVTPTLEPKTSTNAARGFV
jgi:hypothetical protein